jgi:hypothetical protein
MFWSVSPALIVKIKVVMPVSKHHTTKVNSSSKGKGRRVAQKLMSTVFSLS